ncbi:MAG: hypothetical protein ACLSVD_03340 [Eggerthellaceae bacterium]
MSWLVEKGGRLQDGEGVKALRADGSSNAPSRGQVDSDEALLVYKIGGEYLGATRGYPCTNWVKAWTRDQLEADRHLPRHRRTSTTPTSGPATRTDGRTRTTFPWWPNATILGVPDGLLVQNSQPTNSPATWTATTKIASVEFSLDRGETWTKYDIGDMDRNKMVWWSFTYKPELEGAYCLTVRATTESGMTSFGPRPSCSTRRTRCPAPRTRPC